jgi:hypothetical protein
MLQHSWSRVLGPCGTQKRVKSATSLSYFGRTSTVMSTEMKVQIQTAERR